jgi:hypothetical protein
VSHSPEPWTTTGTDRNPDGRLVTIDGIYDANGELVADACLGAAYCEDVGLMNAPDLERIVACVNYCQGIPTEQLKHPPSPQ